ncbi:Uncharacterized protein TPAR_07684 [Tolypocladium paradoxum]|uniref:ARCA-like protein n=1 Tax=Tolypocladium paradoxum TaxID=94208 RepID=A0A2S4KPN0_9HYPO|nr:Uncharacterized protein TPAR_07684 [Tolypocladium paradoxum]
MVIIMREGDSLPNMAPQQRKRIVPCGYCRAHQQTQVTDATPVPASSSVRQNESQSSECQPQGNAFDDGEGAGCHSRALEVPLAATAESSTGPLSPQFLTHQYPENANFVDRGGDAEPSISFNTDHCLAHVPSPASTSTSLVRNEVRGNTLSSPSTPRSAQSIVPGYWVAITTGGSDCNTASSNGQNRRDCSFDTNVPHLSTRDLQTRNGSKDVLQLQLQESCLLRCFIEQLATNFDTTDRQCQYIHVVPLRAMRSTLLLNAICAASARYLIHKFQSTPGRAIEYDGIPLPGLHEESALYYHNICIQCLTREPPDSTKPSNDDILVAITILRFHEQVDVHLTKSDSETYLTTAQAVVHADSDASSEPLHIFGCSPLQSCIYSHRFLPLRRSACLIALRQEIWSVLLYRRPFRLPLYIFDDYRGFDATVADDYDWANRIIVWCAHVLKSCFGTDDTAGDKSFSNGTRDNGSDAENWKSLKSFLDIWNIQQPSHFQPLYYEEPDPSRGTYFPRVWQANACQVMGLQHLELARIVLEVHDTKLERLGIGAGAANKAVEDCLRQSTKRICGLAWSNKRMQTAMVTAGVSISLCGEYFQDYGEQAAIIDLLATLEQEHAWPTQTLVEALQRAWNS